MSAEQLLCHAVGDYILQSHWMATEKTRSNFAAGAHALVYSLPFLLLRPSLVAWLVIVVTHFAIDRWRLARFVVWAKNLMAPRSHRRAWKDCAGTGYGPDVPPFLSVWLLIICDNIIHICINGIALRWL